MDVDPDSVLGRLGRIPDPRRRAGRRYPLPAVLGVVVLGALHGESSLRGMWLWARANWSSLWQPLGFRSPHFPALTTIWNLPGTIDANALDQVINTWVNDLFRYAATGISADGKVLRDSRRADTTPVGNFFSTLKTELVYQQRFATRREARRTICEYVEIFPNRKRRHSALG